MKTRNFTPYNSDVNLNKKIKYIKSIKKDLLRIDFTINTFCINKDGKIKDAEKHTETVKTEWADFIETTTTKGANTANPPANNGKGTGKTKEEILAIKDGAVRRQEMLNNPHLFGLENK